MRAINVWRIHRCAEGNRGAWARMQSSAMIVTCHSDGVQLEVGMAYNEKLWAGARPFGFGQRKWLRMERRKASSFPRGSGPGGYAGESILASVNPLTRAMPSGCSAC